MKKDCVARCDRMDAMRKNAAFDPDRLRRKSECILIQDDPAEKLSGGFYDQTFIHDGPSPKFDAYFAVSYILEGSVRYEDYQGNVFDLNAGDIIVRHAGTRHTARIAYDARGHWLEFAAAVPVSLYHALRNLELLAPDCTCLLPGVDDALIGMADAYIDALAVADTDAGKCRALGLFLQFFAHARHLDRGRRQPGRDSDDAVMRRAKEILGAEFHENITLADVAGRLGMGTERFRKKFAQTAGISPIEYRIRKRLDQADALLLNTPMPIHEIAERLGYPAVSSFTRQYRAFRGQSPKKARRNVALAPSGPSTRPSDGDA